MAIGVTDDKHYKAIADVIRSYTDSRDTFAPSEIPEGIVRAVDKEANTSRQEGYESGHEAGQKSEYDKFWDTYQDNGERDKYPCAFGGYGWNKETLKPKYSIKVNETYMMFAYCGYNGDLDDVFKNRGLSFEIDKPSSASNTGYMFYQSSITAIGTIDLSVYTNTSSVTSIFNAVSLVTIRNLIPPKCAMGTTCWQSGLVNLGIGGEITKDFSLSRCSKLSEESVQSVIDHLADLTGQTTRTLTFHATVGARLTDVQKTSITSRNWTLAY